LEGRASARPEPLRLVRRQRAPRERRPPEEQRPVSQGFDDCHDPNGRL